MRALRSCRRKALHLFPQGRRIARALGELVHQRMLRAQQHERSAEDGVDAGGEHLDLRRRVAFERELDPGPIGAPDPVALHRENLFGPLAQAVGRCEQLVGIGGDAEEPLLEIARLDLRAAPPAAAVHHLLVGQDRLVDRAPVDRRLPPVGQALLEHPNEEPLVPLVVLGVAGRQLAFPRVADAQPLELALHVGDVGAGGLLGMDPALDRGVLRRQAERVPPERVQDVEALHPLGARHHVADDVVANVADVRMPRRIGEHLQAVELRAATDRRRPRRRGARPSAPATCGRVPADGSRTCADCRSGSRLRALGRPRATDIR